MKLAILLLLLFCGYVSGCKNLSDGELHELAKSKITSEDDKLVNSIIGKLKSSSFIEIAALFPLASASEKDQKKIREMSLYFQHGTVVQARPIGYQEFSLNSLLRPNSKRLTLIYEVTFSDGYFNYMTISLDASSGTASELVNILVEDGPMVKTRSDYSFKNKPIFNYFFLLLMVAVPIIILSAIIVCFRTKPKFKWLWIIFIIAPYGPFHLNWTSGEISFSPNMAQLFGIATHHHLLQPAYFSLAIPVGAIIFFAKIKYFDKKAKRHEPRITENENI